MTDPTPWDTPDPEPSWTDGDTPTWEQPAWEQPPFVGPVPGPGPVTAPYAGQPAAGIPPMGQPYAGPVYPAPPPTPTLSGPVIVQPPRLNRWVAVARGLAVPLALIVGFMCRSWPVAIAIFVALTFLPTWVCGPGGRWNGTHAARAQAREQYRLERDRLRRERRYR